jgi:hypothetical protein
MRKALTTVLLRPYRSARHSQRDGLQKAVATWSRWRVFRGRFTGKPAVVHSVGPYVRSKTVVSALACPDGWWHVQRSSSQRGSVCPEQNRSQCIGIASWSAADAEVAGLARFCGATYAAARLQQLRTSGRSINRAAL